MTAGRETDWTLVTAAMATKIATAITTPKTNRPSPRKKPPTVGRQPRKRATTLDGNALDAVVMKGWYDEAIVVCHGSSTQ